MIAAEKSAAPANTKQNLKSGSGLQPEQYREQRP
jgi:hypothetical protein